MAANFELNELIMQLHDDNILDMEDVLLVLDAQRPGRNLHMEQPYWQYPAFDLERIEDQECFGGVSIYQGGNIQTVGSV